MHVLTGLATPNGRPQVADWANTISRRRTGSGTPRHNELIGEAVNSMFEEGVSGLPAHCLGRTIMESGGMNGRIDAEGPERLMTLASIWMAGIDSTTSLLGNAIDAFIEHPDQWELLREHPDLIPNAVEELIRYEAPFRMFYRRTRAEADIGGDRGPGGRSGVRDPRRRPVAIPATSLTPTGWMSRDTTLAPTWPSEPESACIQSILAATSVGGVVHAGRARPPGAAIRAHGGSVLTSEPRPCASSSRCLCTWCRPGVWRDRLARPGGRLSCLAGPPGRWGESNSGLVRGAGVSLGRHAVRPPAHCGDARRVRRPDRAAPDPYGGQH